MEVTKTTAEATLSAIHESLVQLSATLGWMATRQEHMLAVSKKMTAMLVPIATTTLMFMPGQQTTKPSSTPGRVVEQQATKPSLPSLVSLNTHVANAALHMDEVLPYTMPTRCSTVGSAINVGNNHAIAVFPTSGTTHLPTTTSTGVRNSILQCVVGSGANTPTGCSTHVPAFRPNDLGALTRNVKADMSSSPPSQVEAHPVVSYPLLSPIAFPHFNGNDPQHWRDKCLDYFKTFNIPKCIWVILSTLHMEGIAAEWYQAYRLRQPFGDWPQFIDDVQAHFGVRDLPSSTTMLVSAHMNGVGHANRDISTETSNSCLPVSPEDVLVTAAVPTELTLIQVAKSTQLQFVQLKSVLASEYEERKKAHLGNVTQMAELLVGSSDQVLTHFNGVSLFLELWVKHAEKVCSEITLIVIADEVLNYVGDCSLFLEPVMGEPTEVFSAPSNIDLDKMPDRGVVLPSKGCKLQQLLSWEMQQHGTNSDIPILPWDPGTHKLWNATLPDALRKAGGGLTSSQIIGTEMRREMPNMQNHNSGDYSCSVQFGCYLTLGAQYLVYALVRCTNQHTSLNYVQMEQSLLVILFLVLKSIYSCQNLCLLKRSARKFQCRPSNHCVHQQPAREIVQPEVAQHGELVNIACLSLAHAVCTWALYWNRIDPKVTNFQSQGRNQPLFLEVCSCGHLQGMSIENFDISWLLQVHAELYMRSGTTCDVVTIQHGGPMLLGSHLQEFLHCLRNGQPVLLP